MLALPILIDSLLSKYSPLESYCGLNRKMKPCEEVAIKLKLEIAMRIFIIPQIKYKSYWWYYLPVINNKRVLIKNV